METLCHIIFLMDIKLFFERNVPFKYFYQKLTGNCRFPQPSNLVYLSKDPYSVRPASSATQFLLLKKYYQVLEKTGANHWATRRKTKQIRRNSRFVSKKIMNRHTSCFFCNHKLVENQKTNPFNKTIDHFIPLSKGGGGSLDNLRVACSWCNGMKTDIHPYLDENEWIQFLSIVENRKQTTF